MIRLYHKGGASTLRIFGFPIGWAGSMHWGTWWIGLGGWRLMVKAPWNEPLFSERYGLKPTWRIGFGWRVQSFFVH